MFYLHAGPVNPFFSSGCFACETKKNGMSWSWYGAAWIHHHPDVTGSQAQASNESTSRSVQTTDQSGRPATPTGHSPGPRGTSGRRQSPAARVARSARRMRPGPTAHAGAAPPAGHGKSGRPAAWVASQSQSHPRAHAHRHRSRGPTKRQRW